MHLLYVAIFLGYLNGLMPVASFSWVPNLYNLHFLLEIHRPQPNLVNSYRDHMWCVVLHQLSCVNNDPSCIAI